LLSPRIENDGARTNADAPTFFQPDEVLIVFGHIDEWRLTVRVDCNNIRYIPDFLKIANPSRIFVHSNQQMV
jgi:hypothetical protein